MNIKKEGNLEKIVIDPPRRIFPILPHIDNIKYCIGINNDEYLIDNWSKGILVQTIFDLLYGFVKNAARSK